MSKKKTKKNLKKAIKSFKKVAKVAKKLKKENKKTKVRLNTDIKLNKETVCFEKWWNKTACDKVTKIKEDWVKDNEPNDPDDDGGGDHWCVNQMMHNDDAHEMTYDIVKEVFSKGYNNQHWQMNQGDSLYCELDDIIEEAYEAGKNSIKKGKK